jgi:hypothetical protein
LTFYAASTVLNVLAVLSAYGLLTRKPDADLTFGLLLGSATADTLITTVVDPIAMGANIQRPTVAGMMWIGNIHDWQGLGVLGDVLQALYIAAHVTGGVLSVLAAASIQGTYYSAPTWCKILAAIKLATTNFVHLVDATYMLGAHNCCARPAKDKDKAAAAPAHAVAQLRAAKARYALRYGALPPLLTPPPAVQAGATAAHTE